MRMTIGKKLTGSFLALAALVLLSGVVGIVVLDKASKSADTVAKEKAPMQYTVMNAAVAVEKLQKSMVQYTVANTNLNSLEMDLTAHLDEFDMWIAMVQHGTESSEFKNSTYGQIYASHQLKVVTPRGSEKMQEGVGNIIKESSRLKATVAELIKAHHKKISYSVTTKAGEIIPLPDFLNMVQRLQIEWVQQLKDAVAVEGPFTGYTEPQEGLLGHWLFSYSVEDEDIMKLVAKTKKQLTKLRGIAVKINAEPAQAKKQRLFNRGISSTARIEKYFKLLHTRAAEIYSGLNKTQSAKEVAVYSTAGVIQSELTKLIGSANQEMSDALKTAEKVKNGGTTFLLILTVAAVIIAVIMGIFMSRYLAKRILSLNNTTKNIAQGDLADKVDVTSNDELGELAEDTNSMIDNLRDMIGKIHSFSGNLAGAAGSLTDVSRDLDTSAMDLGSKSTQATDATDMMSNSMMNISTIANDSMERVQSVSLATEEMSATINEIAKNTEQARAVTSKAVVTVENTTNKMNELSDAAQEIGQVADVIVNIADQTNLLSLNATIEAARAGEAGKGFAVVANEVKELASQTNQATEDIRQKIEAIQQSSEMTIAEIQEIATIINDINAIVVVIAGAVEEQAVTTTQITEDIGSVSGGIEDMNQNVSSATDIATSVAEDISVVNQTSSHVQSGSGLIKTSASELESLAENLQTLVGKFKL